MRVTIVGAGVAGLACALALQRAGVQVVVAEKAASLGAHACSWWAGGMLAPWCERAHADDFVVSLGAQAVPFWQTHGIHVQQNGTLVVALPRDLPDLTAFAQRTHHFMPVQHAALQALEPHMAKHFDQALFFASEAHLHPREALQAMAQQVNIVFNCSTPPAANFTVDCTGIAAQQALPTLRGVRGEMVLLHSPDVVLQRPVRLLHPRYALYVVPRGKGVFMLGATQVEANDTTVSVRGLLDLLGAACALHPAFAHAQVLSYGAGVRPAFNDNAPHIVRAGNTFYVNGLYRHGFLLAPAMANQLVAQLQAAA